MNIAEIVGSILTSDIFLNLSEWIYKKSSEEIKKINKDGKILDLKIIPKTQFPDLLSKNFTAQYNWAINVSFRDSLTAKDLEQIFVVTDLYLTPRKLHAENESKSNRISSSEILSYSNNSIVLLGQPGAGKTTSVKKIFVDFFSRKNESLNQFGYVSVILLKNLDETKVDEVYLLKELFNKVGVYYNLNTSDGTQEEKKEVLYYLAQDFLESTKMLLIFDGYDEINNVKAKENVIKFLRKLSLNLHFSRFIITSRSGDFDFYIEGTDEFEICPLNEIQVEKFVTNWIQKPEEINDLLGQLKSSPFWDTAIKPLSLAHLCALYERNKSIPEKPKSVYKKIVALLLEDWNNQRSIKRFSKYGGFTPDRKIDFLSRFAYEVTVVCGDYHFTSGTTRLVYEIICDDFDLPKKESKLVIGEIESHSGLIIQTGVDRFEFAHKSIHEYLTGEYLVKLPRLINKRESLLKIPNELAIMVALSSTPEIYFFQLFAENLKEESLNSTFLSLFFTRVWMEKPDWRPNMLLSLTTLYLMNLITKQIIDSENNLRSKSWLLIKSTIPEKLGVLVYDYLQLSVFIEEYSILALKGFKKFNEYYDLKQVLKVRVNKNIPFFRNGKVLVFGTSLSDIAINSIDLKLPKTLYLEENIAQLILNEDNEESFKEEINYGSKFFISKQIEGINL